MSVNLLQALDIEIPIVLAPMAGAVGPQLCAAVSEAGGLGTLPIWHEQSSAVTESIRAVRSLTDRPFGVNLNNNYPQDDHLSASIDAGVGIVSFFWGLHSARIGRAKAAGLIVMQTIGSAAEARQAVDAGVDIIVAQGWEAGGHVWSRVATLALVPSVVDAVPSTPVIAAGGIADGRGLAAVLALGASAGWIGTRFLLADETKPHGVDKDVVAEAADADTMMGKDQNPTWLDSQVRYVGQPADPWTAEYRRNPSQLAGQGIGLVKRRQPAGEIVSEIWAEAKATIRSMQPLA